MLIRRHQGKVVFDGGGGDKTIGWILVGELELATTNGYRVGQR